jgi:GTP-binding protein
LALKDGRSAAMGDLILDIQYIGSFADVNECPDFQWPEYCFIGRSNVGKSSIINYVTGNNEIARTSKKPGKTQSINLFKVSEDPPWLITDLPGYGFAQVSKSMRQKWSRLIDRYIVNRPNLVCTFLLLDIRHPRQENDREFMNRLGEQHIPFCILFTKSDKLKPAELEEAIETYKQEILKEWESLPPIIVTSSVGGKGREEILDFIHKTNAIFTKPIQ